MAVENHRKALGSKKQAFAILFLLAAIKPICGDLIEQPENTAVTINRLAILKCKSSDGVRLLWDSFGNNSQKEELWDGYYLIPKACGCPCCAIDKAEPGRYNLNITARRETAKKYMCTEPGTLMEASAFLIVIESDPICIYNKSDEDVRLSCSIGFYGEWAPKIKWSRSDGGQVEEAKVSVENGQVTSILTMPLTISEVNYTASVYFSETNRPAGVTATNVPKYEEAWQMPPYKRNDESSSNAIGIGLGVGCAVLAVGAVGAGVYFNRKNSKSRKSEKENDAKEQTDGMQDKARAEQKDGSYPGLQMREK